jgi:alkylhydroperoxidase family enzyme
VDVTEKMLKKFGVGDEVLENIKNLKYIHKEEGEILELVKDVTLDGHLDKPEIIEALKKKMSPAELVEVVSVIGLFNYINRFNNSFAILPN